MPLWIGIVIIAFVSGIMGYFLGQQEERQAWNKLISKGIVPKPGG